MKSNAVIGRAAAALLGIALAGVAEARNPHCAGGIQYVVQGMRDKEKGNTEDYQREMGKAVQQLQQCLAEDPADFEAIGYLGWAYAEIDSSCSAGRTFEIAIRGLESKGDKKKVEWVSNNRRSYWAQAFNDGIGKIQAAQQAYPDFCKKPEGEADVTLRDEAKKRYEEAAVRLVRASCLMPGDAQTYRNLGSVYAFQCEFQKAEAVFREGLKTSPSDSTLLQAVRSVRINYANQLVDEKHFDRAIQFFDELVKTEPKYSDHYLSLADVYFKRAQTLEGDARKADFRAAGDAYAKAVELKPGDSDLLFNAGLALQNAGLWARAEAMWAQAAKARPDDVDVLSAWGQSLVELKRCGDAVKTVHQAVLLKPQDKNLHRQFGAIYNKCGSSERSTDELMVYLAMEKGTAVADAAAHAKAARACSDAARTLASDGVPDQIIAWESEGQKLDTWFYWSKKRAYLFIGGTLSRKSDWSTAETAAAATRK